MVEVQGAMRCVQASKFTSGCSLSQILVTVFSRPQLGAILGKMEKEAAERWGRKLSERGQPGRCCS